MRKADILIVDDHPIYRRGLTEYLMPYAHINVVGAASNGAEAIRFIMNVIPDIILLDIQMPLVDGRDLLKTLRTRGVASKVIVISQSSDDDYLNDLVSLGVEGHILKSEEPSEIIKAIDTVLSGQKYFSSRMAERYFDFLQCSLKKIQLDAVMDESSLDSDQAASISVREKEVALLVASGFTNKSIAEELQCSLHTVKCHKANIMRKIGAKNSAEIAAWISRSGSKYQNSSLTEV